MSTFTIDDTVTELTPEEGRKLFDNLARAELGVSGQEFLRRLAEGDIPQEWSEDAVSRLEVLTPSRPKSGRNPAAAVKAFSPSHYNWPCRTSAASISA